MEEEKELLKEVEGSASESSEESASRKRALEDHDRHDDDCHCHDEDCHCHDDDCDDDDCHCHDHAHHHDHHHHDHEHHHDHDGCGCGCGCGCHEEEEEEEEEEGGVLKHFLILGFSLAFLILSFIDLYKLTGVAFFHYADFAWIAVVLCGYSIFRSAIRAISKKKITADVLIAIAILASIALEIVRLSAPSLIAGSDHGESYVFAAGEVAFLMYLGEIIEDLTVRKSRSGIKKMMDLAPQTVERIKEDGETEIVSLEEIEVGDLVLVRPGSVIAVDGVVESGSSAVNESAITGESIPVEKEIGSSVYGGTMNENGMLRVRVAKAKEDMWISKVTGLMREAEGKKAPIARLADRWASYIVPAACILSLLVFMICALVPSVSIPSAIVRGVTILVVFCPCSLALATPTAIAAAIGRFAKDGVMVKNGGAIEEMAKVSVLCLDKTGTLTKGEPEVVRIVSRDLSEEDLLILAASAEKASEHPIAKAIVRAADGKKLFEATDLEAQAGVGVRAQIEGKTIEMISYLRASDRLDDYYKRAAEEEAEKGRTTVCLFVDGAVQGVLSLTDGIREEAAQAIKEVKEMGVSPVMLTGDHALTAKNVADALGIERFEASLLPEDKTAKVEAFKESGKVCMVGDGVNDAPSLVAADCSVSMAEVGSDVAVESSDFALMDGKIGKIPWILKLSRRVLRTIKLNIIFAMGVNVVAVVLSALGILTPATGALVHNLASILVVIDSALILAAKKR